MARISRTALLPYSAEQVFALVNDIAAYPQFMDGCVGADVQQRSADSVTARLTLGKAGLRYAFTTRNALQPPQSMQMQLVEGPFRKFSAEWRFDVLSDAACKVSFDLEFELTAALVDAALAMLLESTAGEMVNAVARRARQLYGSASSQATTP
ncbi:MAG TPA: type II toxin-antitoxin system RatA family toxin [Candidatus Acidoferrum sp.]|nr:type II toxin-antitoxin system RatA family toxin [Candidatus Acidoferrum sp.]